MPTEAPSAFSHVLVLCWIEFLRSTREFAEHHVFSLLFAPPATLNIFPEEDYRAPILGFTFANLGPFLDEIVVQVSHFLALS